MRHIRAIAYVGVAHCIITAEECAEKEICGVIGPLCHRKDIGTVGRGRAEGEAVAGNTLGLGHNA